MHTSHRLNIDIIVAVTIFGASFYSADGLPDDKSRNVMTRGVHWGLGNEWITTLATLPPHNINLCAPVLFTTVSLALALATDTPRADFGGSFGLTC